MRYLRYSISFNVQKEAGLYLKLFLARSDGE